MNELTGTTDTPFLNIGAQVKAPPGLVAMLRRRPVMAMKDWNFHRKTSLLRYPNNTQAALIMRTVKKCFTYQRDEKERWIIPCRSKPFTGDCEDFALACRDMANNSLFVSARLLLCKERAMNAEAHIVLLIGEWVLDCRLSQPANIKDWLEMYRPIAISSPELLGPWFEAQEP